jgi:hypothetical protein
LIQKGGTIGKYEVRAHGRTFSIYYRKSVFSDREISQRIDGSNVRQRRNRKILPRWERLATDLVLILERV